MQCHKQQFGSPTLRIRKGPGIASGALVLGIGGKCYFLPVLRASFILSPGLNSEAPFDMPVVRESFILSPGANSDAPREFFVAELFICVPGAYPEAPLVDPAKLGDETINIAVAAINQVFFISGLLFGFDPNVGDTKKFSLLATLLVRPGSFQLSGTAFLLAAQCIPEL